MAKDKNGDLLAPENLLYIAQGAADADGALTFATAPRESAENAFVALYGPGESVQPGYQPVSYTHLDVYKRQAPSCSSRS